MRRGALGTNGLMYQNSVQKLLTDECYPESVMEEFINFVASLNDLTPFY